MAEQFSDQRPNQGNSPGMPQQQPPQGGYFPPPPGTVPPPQGGGYFPQSPGTPPPGGQQPPGPPRQGPPPEQPPRRKRHRVRNTLLAVVGVLVLIIIISVIASGGGKGGGSGKSAAITTPSAAPTAAKSLAPTLTAAQQTYVSDMRSALTFNSTTDATIVTLGQQVCRDRSTGEGQRKTERDVKTMVTNSSAVNQVTRISERDLCRKHLPPKPKPTVEYVVTGTPGADVTYGPAGSDFNGSVPMDVKARLGSPQYYAINAQLQGGGSVQCAIKVNGKVISSANANGGFNIADCEIDQDPFTGKWENTNG
jgi:hypothetical protein